MPMRGRRRTKRLRHECVGELTAAQLNPLAIRRRARCGSLRGSPVLCSHFSPAFAPHVGQATLSVSSRVALFDTSFFLLMASRAEKPPDRAEQSVHRFEKNHSVRARVTCSKGYLLAPNRQGSGPCRLILNSAGKVGVLS